jgi:hypothetical protein
MTYYVQLFAICSAIGGLLWIIAGLLASIGEPSYEDEIEAEYPDGPGLPHHRGRK